MKERKRRRSRERNSGSVTPTPPTTQPDGPSDRKKWLQGGFLMLAVGCLALMVAGILSQLDSLKPPRVILETKSYAVTLVPDTIVDLVQAARPRFSVEPGGAQFAGIRLATPVPLTAFDPHVSRAEPPSIRLIQSLDITPGCTVRFEHWVDRSVRLTIERLPGMQLPDDTAKLARCIVYGELLTTDDGVEIVDRDVERESPIDFTFAPGAPLRLRHLPVAELRFETEEAGQLRKAISGEALLQSATINATLRRPDYDDNETELTRARLGEVINLGELQGEIVELIVADTMRTLYNGTASRPEIGGHVLRPSLLEDLANREWVRLMLVFFFSALGLLAAIMQVFWR